MTKPQNPKTPKPHEVHFDLLSDNSLVFKLYGTFAKARIIELNYNKSSNALTVHIKQQVWSSGLFKLLEAQLSVTIRSLAGTCFVILLKCKGRSWGHSSNCTNLIPIQPSDALRNSLFKSKTVIFLKTTWSNFMNSLRLLPCINGFLTVSCRCFLHLQSDFFVNHWLVQLLV